MNNNEKKVVISDSNAGAYNNYATQRHMSSQQPTSMHSLVKEKIREKKLEIADKYGIDFHSFNSTDYNTQNNDNSNQSTYSRYATMQQFITVNTFIHVSKKEEVVLQKEEIARQKAKERINRIIKGIFLAIFHILFGSPCTCC
jgi:hypothetical protein